MKWIGHEEFHAFYKFAALLFGNIIINIEDSRKDVLWHSDFPVPPVVGFGAGIVAVIGQPVQNIDNIR